MLVLLTVGVIMLFSTSSLYAKDRYGDQRYLLKRQLAWMLVGGVACITAANVPYTKLRGVGTLVLIGSSVTMQLGVRAVARDDRRGFLGWLGVTFVLGSAFVALQAWDWTRLDFSVASNAYGSAFYLTTGFHGLHVIGGLVAMIVVAGRASSPRFGARDTPSVEMLSYYWHFVDVVWIALYATIFLLK